MSLFFRKRGFRPDEVCGGYGGEGLTVAKPT